MILTTAMFILVERIIITIIITIIMVIIMLSSFYELIGDTTLSNPYYTLNN